MSKYPIALVTLAASAIALTLGVHSSASAEDQRRQGQLERTNDRQGSGLFNRRQRDPAPPADMVFAYGSDPLQDIGFYNAAGRSEVTKPLIIFVHGGGWRRGDKQNATGPYKSGHYTQQDYHFATINYRLVPEATVEQQAQDTADAVKALIDRAQDLRIDTDRIVLMGHSAGAHLVSLVSTDPQYLRAAGLSHDDILGTIPLDGAAYHVPEQMQGKRRFMRNMYENAFGEDRDRQRALSPTLHAARPNVDNFLILYVDRDDGAQQSQQLAAQLEAAGVDAQQQQFEGRGLRGHAQINMEMGNPDYAATPVVDAWLRDLFAE